LQQDWGFSLRRYENAIKPESHNVYTDRYLEKNIYIQGYRIMGFKNNIISLYILYLFNED